LEEEEVGVAGTWISAAMSCEDIVFVEVVVLADGRGVCRGSGCCGSVHLNEVMNELAARVRSE
jgi:hypothetical protein